MRASLRGQLLAWLLIPLGVLTAVDVVDDYLDAQRTAGIVFDRLLIASARTIAQDVKVEAGATHVIVPRGTLEAFAWPAPDLVYYRVSAPSGELLAGTPDLPSIAEAEVDPDAPQYRTSDFRGEPLRAVAFLQPLGATPGAGPCWSRWLRRCAAARHSRTSCGSATRASRS